MDNLDTTMKQKLKLSYESRDSDRDFGQTSVRAYICDKLAAELVIAEEYAIKLENLPGSPFPEHIFHALEKVPDQSLVSKIVLVEQPPAQAFQRLAGDDSPAAFPWICRKWGRSEGGTLFLYDATNGTDLPRRLLHLWAHLLIKARERDGHRFKLACQAEYASSAQKQGLQVDPEEGWAIQLGELILGPGQLEFELSLQAAPFTSVVLGQVLNAALAAGPQEYSDRTGLPVSDRLAQIEEETLPAARSALVSLVQESDSESVRQTALTLLAYLGSEEHWWLLCETDSLDLCDQYLTDNDISFVRILKRLKMLDLSGTAITWHALEQIQGLTALTELRLGRTAVTNSSLDSLRELHLLELLDLHDTAITDSGLAELAALPGLRKLNLAGCEVTELGLSMLKQRLPDCEVITASAHAS